MFVLGSDFCVCFWDGGFVGWVSFARAGLLVIWGPGRDWGRGLVGRGMVGTPGGFVVGRPAGDVFDGVFLCCPFSHEMSWMRSGTYLSPFLRVFVPAFVMQDDYLH